MHAAVAEDGEVLAEADLRDLDGRQNIRFVRAIEDLGQGCQNRIVVMGVVPELRDGLGDEHVEPVQRLGLVGVDIVVRLGQNRGRGQARRGAEDVVRCRSLVAKFQRGRGWRVDGRGPMLPVDNSIAVGMCTLCGDGVGGWRVAEDEEFDKGADEDHDGELAEEEAFGERQSILEGERAEDLD